MIPDLQYHHGRHAEVTAVQWLQMIEEFSMAVAMSVAFALPTFYFCELQGSFFIIWLVWLISLADGIGKSLIALVCHTPDSVTRSALRRGSRPATD